MQCKIELPEPTLVYEHKPTGLKLYHYTAEQVRAAILAERERCAWVCEELRDKALSAQHGRSDDLQNVMLRQVAHTGAGEFAAAIRRGSV